jgi:alcohol dehydrogenase class IV
MMSVTDIRQWNFPTRMVFGAGVIARLPELCAELGMNNPLLVTDEGLKDMAIVSDTMALLKNGASSVAVFSGVKGNPTNGNVEAGLKVFRDGGHDSVVAFGGGSALDAGKAIAFMAGQDRPIWDFEDVGDNWLRARTENVAPVIAVPTTSGTGSEVGRASVISNEETKAKMIIFHPSIMPEIALCDPELTLGLPAHLTAATGFDAFVHCFEAFCAPGYHPMADGIALEGMCLAAKHLPRAVHAGDDLEARTHMMTVAAMGATAFQKGLGGVHALSHAIAALYDTHHGLTNAVVMPYVVRANETAIQEKMARIARALELDAQNYDGVFDWLMKFREDINIPNTLSDMNVPDTRAEEIGVRALGDPTAGGNPISHDAATYSAIFRKACEGSLS